MSAENPVAKRRKFVAAKAQSSINKTTYLSMASSGKAKEASKNDSPGASKAFQLPPSFPSQCHRTHPKGVDVMEKNPNGFLWVRLSNTFFHLNQNYIFVSVIFLQKISLF